MENNTLKHAGIKGMKWGVRRYQNKDGTLTPAGKKRYADAHEDYVRAHDRKNPKSMSDKELRDRLNRLQMEQQYSKMTAKKKGMISKGSAIVMTAVAAAATATVTAYATKYANKGASFVNEFFIKPAADKAEKKVAGKAAAFVLAKEINKFANG